ncbi:MAG: YkgJ family cysteine cluster protein [Archangium sp.]|nr:YkgJ family cysteine cluster protein [Archangium sp.]
MSLALSQLCLDCGLCCDGTLFRYVAINGSEREELVRLGIGVGENRKGEVMWLPCGKLAGKCCTIYEARPGGCRRFICSLGKRLEAKEVSLEEAKAQVVEMQAKIATLKALLPPSDEPVLRQARAHIDSTTSQVNEAQLKAFQAVEDQRYAVFMPPPA